jgi:hypothetical protein
MNSWRSLAAALAAALLLPLPVLADGQLGPAGLRARHAALAPQFADNPFGGPLVLQSQEAGQRIDGDVYAVVDHPYAKVAAALSDPAQWCEILILHLNTKYCRPQDAGSGTRLALRVGRKEPQSLHAATLLSFGWQPSQVRSEYFSVQMDAPDGPYDTHDYRLLAEAVPLDGGRTLLRMGYAFSYGRASNLAMSLYLNTLGRDKVGFTRAGAGYVGGMRGVAERNTMRYYLAIDAYLDSLAAPAGQRVERRLRAWFDATERYPRQLREVDRDAYLRMKREELHRQAVTS